MAATANRASVDAEGTSGGYGAVAPSTSELACAVASPARVKVRRRVEWSDTDAAGIYHWSTALKFVEEAERALHDALGITGQTFGRTPRVRIEADFRRSLRFNDVAEVDLAVGGIGRTSLEYRFRVTHDDEVCVEGAATIVHLDRPEGAPEPWPADVRDRLAAGGDLGHVTEV
jgi:YbgC/YbaW family acyl-CoA thioester hydrolase